MSIFHKNIGLYSGLAIADYFIEKSLQDGSELTNMSVLKMIFFAQGFGFADLKLQLIKDDFYAWPWGPVEINTYKTFKKYGGRKIESISNETQTELNDIKSKSNIIEFLDSAYELKEINPFQCFKSIHNCANYFYSILYN